MVVRLSREPTSSQKTALGQHLPCYLCSSLSLWLDCESPCLTHFCSLRGLTIKMAGRKNECDILMSKDLRQRQDTQDFYAEYNLETSSDSSSLVLSTWSTKPFNPLTIPGRFFSKLKNQPFASKAVSNFIILFIYLLAVMGLHCCTSFSLLAGNSLLTAEVSRVAKHGLQGTWASAVVEHRLSCCAARVIRPDQGSNSCLLHWQADSLPVSYQGSPFLTFLWFAIDHKVLSSVLLGLARKGRATYQMLG